MSLKHIRPDRREETCIGKQIKRKYPNWKYREKNEKEHFKTIELKKSEKIYYICNQSARRKKDKMEQKQYLKR